MKVKMSNRIMSSAIIFLIILATGMVLATNYMNGMSARLFDEVINRIVNDTKSNSKIIELRLNDYVTEIKTLAKSLGLLDYDKDEILELLKSYQKENFLLFMYCDIDTGMAYNTEDKAVSIKDTFTYVKLKLGYSDISNIPTGTRFPDEYLLSFSSPVFKDGRPVYAITGCIFFNKLTSQLTDYFYEGKGYSLVVCHDGEVLVSSDSAYENTKDNIFNSWIPEAEAELMKTDFAIKRINSITFTNGTKTSVISYAPIANVRDRFLCMIIPEYVRSANAGAILNSMLYLFFFMIVGMIIFSVYLTCADYRTIKKIERLAFYDQLTNVRNLNKFKLDAAKIIRTYTDRKWALIRFDVDKFRIINEMFGFDTGNKILKNIVSAMSDTLYDGEIIARMMKDDFIVMINYISDGELVARKDMFIRKFNDIHGLNQFGYKLDFSMGIYRIAGDDKDITKMIDRVTLAHKTAKLLTSNSYVFYNDSIRDKEIRTKEIENTMVRALEFGEFVVYVQPKYFLSDLTIGGAESLVRWKNLDMGVISPTEFIPIFEKNGFVINIDNYMLEETCKFQRYLLDKGIKPVPISVNQSKLHISDENYVKHVKGIVKKYNLPPDLIELELTETVMHDNIEVLIHIIKELNDYGFVISIDDFGSGYSSLNMLKEIHANVLKIDREFLQHSEENQRGISVLANIIRLAKELNMLTVTEGVETRAQEKLLKDLGCDMVQGFLYARPMPIHELEYLLEKQDIPPEID